MARFNPHHNNSKIYPAMREFAMECLLRDGSVLQPGQAIWTPENLDELDRSFVQNPDAGDGTYYEKLGQQVAQGSRDSRKLMAELHWLLFAFPSDITPSTKEERVREIWSWSGEELPDTVISLDHGILEGLGHTGQAYNNHRWRELSFVIGALQRWKKMPLAEREDIVAQPARFIAFLDDAPGVAGRQLRHILPHLLFPYEFERISSPRHKREILEGFGVAPRREVNKMDTASLDAAIFTLRKKLEAEHDREIDFYEPDIESSWRDRGATYLISWNPTRWDWVSFNEDRVTTIEEGTVIRRWRTSSKKPKVDDRVYLLRTGQEPRGIIARGRVAKVPYTDAHWDATKAQNGETTDFIDVEFEDIRDPALDAFVPVELLARKIAGQDWSPQSSGIVIKPAAVRVLNRLWEAAEPAQAEVGITETDTSATAQNLILYGPPGTGKTFSSATEAVRLCGEPVSSDRDALMKTYDRLLAEGRIEFVTFHQSMAYEDFVEGRQPVTGSEDGEGAASTGFRLETIPGTFRRIAKRAETSRGRASTDDQIKLVGRQVFKMSLGEANNPEDAHLFEDAIKGGYAVLGFEDIDWSDKKFEARDAFIEACKALGEHNANVDARSGVVQMPFIFRNWVRKEDIVVVSKGNGLFRAIGVFTGDYEFCPRLEGDYGHRRNVRWVWVDREGAPVEEIYSRRFMQKSIYMLYGSELNMPALERYINSQQVADTAEPEPFVLIIDEINRANISKVFGELITLLEPDKRLGQPNQIKVRLPYSGDDFGVPSNLHILGTMNTADRSIALLDTALRRRFIFRELMPEPSLLRDAAVRTKINLPLLLTTMNDRVEYLYDREHQIGHAYFMGCKTGGDVDEVMRHKVIPLLAEYFFEDWAKVAAILGDLESHDRDFTGGFLRRTALKAPPGLDSGEAFPRFRWSVRTADEGFDYEKLITP